MSSIVNNNTFLSFRIAGEYFALEISNVLEVLIKQNINKIPNVDGEMKGVINFRGEIVPVYEARQKFGLPNRSANEKYVIIVLEYFKAGNKIICGILVDKVKEVININIPKIQKVPKMNETFHEDFISGIYKQNEDFIMILNIERMLQ